MGVCVLVSFSHLQQGPMQHHCIISITKLHPTKGSNLELVGGRRTLKYRQPTVSAGATVSRTIAYRSLSDWRHLWSEIILMFRFRDTDPECWGFRWSGWCNNFETMSRRHLQNVMLYVSEKVRQTRKDYYKILPHLKFLWYGMVRNKANITVKSLFFMLHDSYRLFQEFS